MTAGDYVNLFLIRFWLPLVIDFNTIRYGFKDFKHWHLGNGRDC